MIRVFFVLFIGSVFTFNSQSQINIDSLDKEKFIKKSTVMSALIQVQVKYTILKLSLIMFVLGYGGKSLLFMVESRQLDISFISIKMNLKTSEQKDLIDKTELHLIYMLSIHLHNSKFCRKNIEDLEIFL
ncbi:MAG: hypothetical protein CM15mP65_02990 [Crocinitomicaceae bacterium]|nr:MAG: hypothetical protein CM15mP65_02990 [Crocinitomicaceae bacterium]